MRYLPGVFAFNIKFLQTFFLSPLRKMGGGEQPSPPLSKSPLALGPWVTQVQETGQETD